MAGLCCVISVTDEWHSNLKTAKPMAETMPNCTETGVLVCLPLQLQAVVLLLLHIVLAQGMAFPVGW